MNGTELADSRLRRTLELCARAHPYYRETWQARGVDPREVRTVADLDRLPLTAKDDFMRSPHDFVLQGDALADLPMEERTLWNVAYTTGTTSGQPSPFFNTTHDQYHIMLQARVCGEVEGLGPGDVVANLYPLAPVPLGGFLCCVRTAEVMGLAVVSALTGGRHPEYPVRRSLDEAVHAVSRAAPTVLWGVPSFVRRFLRRARELEVALPGVRMVLTTGEAVDRELLAEYLDHLRAFGADDPQVRARYAATELQGGLVQCATGVPPHHVTGDLYHLEVVDPDSGRPVPEGEEGMIALTHLHRRGTVLLRYLLGDVARLSTGRCESCGRHGAILRSAPRRVGRLVKVKGMLVNPDLVVDTLSADRAIAEFQVVVRAVPAEGREELVVRLEAGAADRERLAREVPACVQRAVLVRPRVEFVSPGSLHDPERDVKARRFADERPVPAVR